MDRGKPSVLLISDGRPAEDIAQLLDAYAVKALPSLAAATDALSKEPFDAVVLELDTRSLSTEFQMNWIRDHSVDAALIAFGEPNTEFQRLALAAGAADYLSMPTTREVLTLALDSALSVDDRGPTLPPRIGSSGLLGSSPQMVAVRSTVARVAPATATVLVRGETGTGKELVARAVHDSSARRDAPFIKVHAAALPDALLESELFGYEKGAFTGASARKAGRVELAEGGTLFFDEIGDVSPTMQVKLLRLIQDREYERLGGTRTLRADVRFIAATHRDLEHLVETGGFRQDLFYRLNVVSLWLPPLRARRSDVGLLVRSYLEHFREANGKPILEFEEPALRLLQAQRWPGNVRQLVNFVERMVVLAQGGTITAADVRSGLDEQMEFLTQAASQEQAIAPLNTKHTEPMPVAAERAVAGISRAPGGEAQPSAVVPLREEIRRAELRALTKALLSAKGNRALAARMLGVSRRTLYTKLDEHGIS